MEIDEVWTHIGEFGSSQKLIFYCLSLVQIFACLQVFIFNFVGVDPGWRCRTGVGETSTTTVVTANCQLYKEGKCVPEYSKEFTSIVTEVITARVLSVSNFVLKGISIQQGG